MKRRSFLGRMAIGLASLAGAIAAIFAVDPSPSTAFVVVLFLWLFFWEIGGQNVPHDWADIEEDRRLDTQTRCPKFPIREGN